VGYEKEKQILKATLLDCVFIVAAIIILIPLLGIYGAAISLLIGNICLYIFKRKYSNKIIAQWK
jgi:O-antigen/teichoic acid export membrane protein